MDSESSTLRSLLTLLAGIAVVVALLTWWVGWALPVVILAIILIVMGHEFGHFITAKRAGMKVTDFFVGFGPVLWSTTVGETRYGVRAILAGGYVKVPGMMWGDSMEPAEEAKTYRSASYPRKVIFASAGSLMHLVMALVLAWASLAFIGAPSTSHVGVSSFTKWDGHAKNAAQLAGMRVGDRIVSVDGRTVTSYTQLIDQIRTDAGQRTTIVVERNGHDLTLHATPVDGRTIKSNGQALATGTKAKGFLGIGLVEQTVHDSWYSAIPASVGQIGSLIVAGTHAIIHVFSPGQFASLFHQVASPAAANKPSNQAARPSSIVGVVRIAVQSAPTDPSFILDVLIALNIFVGLLNMLPMLPLDGGYVAIATYERLRSRRGQRYQADVNRLAPVVYAFMTVLLVLFACTLYLDIAHPIANPFH